VKICNRFKVPYVPYATGFYGPRSHCHVENELIIDMKRMKYCEFDDQHWCATIEPGVIYSPFQEECLKRGGYVVVGGGGAQASVMANLLSDGWSPLSLRIGLPHRRIQGLEMVLPDGDVGKLGALAIGDDAFWGEGIGRICGEF
jgi:FAD/FMN-containing dehydrogenase